MKSRWWQPVLLALIVASTSCSRKDASESEDAAGKADSGNASGVSDKSEPFSQAWREDALFGGDPQLAWKQFTQAALKELAEPGADPSDILAKARALGMEPGKIFEFMRDSITLEPYDGALRGPRGTLMGRAGNALDRALLAQTLLKAGGTESRLISGRLSDAQAESLLSRFFSGARVPKVLADLTQSTDDAALDAEVEALARKAGLSESGVEDLLDHASAQAEKFWTQADANRAAQYGFLGDQLRPDTSKEAIDRTALSRKLRERLRDHYWLQIRTADGTWSDFDPAFPDAQIGVSYGSGANQLAEIPKEKFHQLEFSLVYETVSDGASKEEVLVAGRFASADALFEPLEFRVQPIDSSLDPRALADMSPAQQIEALRQMSRFQAVLRSGSRVIGSRIFDLDGRTYDPASGPSLGMPGGSFFGDSLGGGEDVLPEFVELRVVMRLMGPGRQPMNQTRTLVRAEDVMAPTFAPPILEWEMLLQPQWISAEFVGFTALNQVVAAGNALMQAASTDRSTEMFQPPPSAPMILLQLALLRQRAAADILSKQADVRAFVDEPMLTISGNRLTGIHEEKEQISGERHIDIVENAIRYVPGNDTSQSAAYDTGLLQGVADAALEDRLLRVVFPDTISQSGVAIIEQSQAQKRPILSASSQDTERLGKIGMSTDDIEWIRDNESPATRLLVAITDTGSAAWWSVRPDGNAILRTSGGRGEGLAEYVLVTTELGIATLCAVKIGSYAAIKSLGGSPSTCARDQIIACAITTVLAPFLGYGAFAFHWMHSISWALVGADIAIVGWNATHGCASP